MKKKAIIISIANYFLSNKEKKMIKDDGDAIEDNPFERARNKAQESENRAMNQDTGEKSDDPFEQSRDRNNLRKPSDKNDDKE